MRILVRVSCLMYTHCHDPRIDACVGALRSHVHVTLCVVYIHMCTYVCVYIVTTFGMDVQSVHMHACVHVCVYVSLFVAISFIAHTIHTHTITRVLTMQVLRAVWAAHHLRAAGQVRVQD